MPTYEYRCPRGHGFDEFQSITAEPVAKCPRCGRRARRQVSAGAGLIFKGSGFYVTDYKRGGGSDGASASGPPRPSASKQETEAGSRTTEKTGTSAP
jgi:putative FmdB family regulatory protein